MRKTHTLIRSLVIMLSLTSSSVTAQDFLGYSTGSWAGINSLHVNPANVVDSRYMVDINLAMGNFFVANDYLTMDQNELFNGSLFNDSTGGNYVNKHFAPDYSKPNHNLLINTRVQGPSFMFSFGKKKNGVRPNGIAFS